MTKYCLYKIFNFAYDKISIMKENQDHPGVYIPPPLFYVACFFLAVFIQKIEPIDRSFFLSGLSKVIGATILLIGMFFNLPSIRQFFKTKNTLIPIKPANSLQTTGIYSICRNPMYVSLVLFYSAIAFLLGNWWHFILLPLLILVVQEYVIRKEEKYLDRRFGSDYRAYRAKVRRWI